MKAALLLALAVASVLPGCAGPAGPHDMDAATAYAKAIAAAPGLTFVSLEAVEGAPVAVGPSLAVFATGDREQKGNGPTMLAFQDDGLDDGALGDGRTSSWTAQFASPSALVELRVFADGRGPVRREHPLPQYLLDQNGSLVGDTRLDSPAIAHKVFPSPPANGTVLYSFSVVSRDLAPRRMLLRAGESAVEDMGWSLEGGTWSVSRLSPLPDPVLQTTRFGRDGRLWGHDSSSPMRRTMPLLEDDSFEDSQEAGSTRAITFVVEAGTRRLEGDLYAQSTVATQLGEVEAPHLRLIDPAGNVRYHGQGQADKQSIELGDIVPGTWTLELGHEGSAPARVHVYAFLWATISLQ